MDDQVWYDAFRYWPQLMAKARDLGLSHHDAEDVVSDAVIAAATYPLLDKDRLNQFLLTAIRRDWVDTLRRGQRQLKIHQLLREQSTMDSPEIRMSQRDEIARMARSVGMTPAEWAVVRLAADGHTHAEIARRLHITDHASEVALSRARSKARRLAGANRVNPVTPHLVP